MPRLIILAAFLLGSVAPAKSGAASEGPAQPLADSVSECATVTASARMQAVGYNHVVTLANHCQRAVTCEVWTDVDPSPHATLRAKAGGTAETITRVGSPARAVQAGKVCRFDA